MANRDRTVTTRVNETARAEIDRIEEQGGYPSTSSAVRELLMTGLKRHRRTTLERIGGTVYTSAVHAVVFGLIGLLWSVSVAPSYITLAAAFVFLGSILAVVGALFERQRAFLNAVSDYTHRILPAAEY